MCRIRPNTSGTLRAFAYLMKLARGTRPIEIGSFVGSYELLDVIGVGGMGVVFDAECDGRHVAVKLLSEQRLSDERALRRFHDEALVGRIINHPNVTATLEEGSTVDGVPFLVMERVCGETLGVRIQREGCPTLPRAVTLIQQILAGLGAMHAVGIVHGDVKSDNVLVERLDDGSDRARLIDFGLAHVQFSPTDDIRRPGPDEELVSGTPEYMAPEVIQGKGSSMSSDLYAVGVILYELLTGSTPFGGGSPAEIVRRHLDDEVVPPSLRAEVEMPSMLDRIVLRAIAKDPAKRFPDADSFAAALAVVMPLLQDTRGGRTTQRMSRDTPTLNWSREIERRVARGTPRRVKREGQSR